MTDPIMKESIDALALAAEQARETLREAHGVIKDLRQAIAEARRLKPDLVKSYAEAASVKLEELIPVITEAIDNTMDKSYREAQACLSCGKIGRVPNTPGAYCAYCDTPIGPQDA